MHPNILPSHNGAFWITKNYYVPHVRTRVTEFGDNSQNLKPAASVFGSNGTDISASRATKSNGNLVFPLGKNEKNGAL